MDKEAATVALAVVTLLAVFVAIQPILPVTAERFSELGVLGPNKVIGGYPTNVTAGQQFQLYGYIGNHDGVVSYYQMLVKLGNKTTQISNSTYARAPLLHAYPQLLGNNETAVFPMSLSVNQQGTNVRLIFELWGYNATNSQFTYTGLWNQLWLNVTSH